MTSNEAIDNIRKVRNRIAKNKLDPVALANDMVALGVYNSYLADVIADSHLSATQAAGEVFSTERDKGTSVSESELKSRFESVAERHNYEQIQHIYKSTNNLMEAIKTKVYAMEGQLKREGVQV